MKKTKWRQCLRGMCKWGGVTLCVLLFALWLWSGWWASGIFRAIVVTEAGVEGFESPIELRLGNGLLYFDYDKSPPPEDGVIRWWSGAERMTFDQPEWRWSAGLEHSTQWIGFTVPLWFPFLLIALPAGLLFWSDRRRRMRKGCCAQCGYDLTGNQSGTCPECGAVTVAKAAST